MKSIPLFTLVFAGIFLLSFTPTNKILKNERLKYIIVAGDTTTRFIYNADGTISEIENLSGYEKFHYNNDGRLIKYEKAADPKAHWGTRSTRKQEIMTAKNSAITSYKIFEYDSLGRLSEEKSYVSNYQQQDFTFTSGFTVRFTYNIDNKVARANTYNSKGDLYEYSTYEYDKRGNRTKEFYYFQLPGESSLRLMSETKYTYDKKVNPNKTVKGLRSGGYTDNPNNIIERKIFCKIPDCGNAVLTSLYSYSEAGLPLTCKYSNNTSTFIYVYE